MATQTRNPTSDEAASGTLSGVAGTRNTLVSDYPDTVGATAITFGTTAAAITFGFSVFTVPAGSTSISVQVLYYDGEAANGANNCAGRIKAGGTYYNAATHNPSGTTYTSRTDNWATNPKSAQAWTVDDVNGVGANALQAFGIGSTDSNPTFRVSSVQLQVTYTAPLPARTGSGSGSAISQTGSGSGAVVASGSGAGTTSAQTGSGAGTVQDPGPGEITGAGSGTATAQTGSGNGATVVSGAGSGSATAQTGTGAGDVVASGSGASTISAQAATGTGTATTTGAGGGSAATQTGSGTGTIVIACVGATRSSGQVGSGTATTAGNSATAEVVLGDCEYGWISLTRDESMEEVAARVAALIGDATDDKATALRESIASGYLSRREDVPMERVNAWIRAMLG